MIRLPASKAREKFSEIINEVAYGNERLILQRHGKDVVAVISAYDLARLEELEDRADLKLVDKVIAQENPPVPWSEARKRLSSRK
jgi:prevent-host-death family protein